MKVRVPLAPGFFAAAVFLSGQNLTPSSPWEEPEFPVQLLAASSSGWDATVPTVRDTFQLPTDESGVAHVELAGPLDVWRMRPAAEYFDQQLPGLKVKFVKSCKGTDEPVDTDGTTCVRVEVKPYGADLLWHGLAHVNSLSDGTTAPGIRVIQLNSAMQSPRLFKARKRTAAHEFGHILGMTHHTKVGLMGSVRCGWINRKGACITDMTDRPSRWELNVLKRAYNGTPR